MNKHTRLVESMEMAVVATEFNLDFVFSNMTAAWRGAPYGELSTLLGYLMFLDHLHHTHHWISAGNPAYGDHLLFQRLYEGTQGEIDSLGEKLVGLGSAVNVDMFTLVQQCAKWTSIVTSNDGTIPSGGGLVKRSLTAEMAFIKYIDAATSALDGAGLLTYGLDNMLAGISDTHEGHVYLLKQRAQEGHQG